jgi:hypothetical protein
MGLPADRIPSIGHTILERRGARAPCMGLVGAVCLAEQVECALRELERETGPPA